MLQVYFNFLVRLDRQSGGARRRNRERLGNVGILAARDPVALDRFRGEVRNARKITHANVCRMYDIGEVDGHVFLSMEYIDGEDLAHVLARMGRPSQEKALEIALASVDVLF